METRGTRGSIMATSAFSKSTNRASLPELPEELLLNVLTFISERSTLYSLSVASKLFHRLTAPFLYRTLRFEMKAPPTSLEKFLRTILTHPELVLYVRVIDIQKGWPWHSYSPSAHVGSAAMIRPIEELIRTGRCAGFSESSNNELFKVAEQDTPGIREISWARVFLTHLPNLQSLHVHGIKWSCWLLLAEILNSATCEGSIGQRPFAKLRDVSIQYFPRMYSLHQDTFFDSGSGLISYLLRLPSLRTLKLVGFRDTLFESGSRWPKGQCDADTFDLRGFDTSISTLNHLLLAFNSLRHLTLDFLFQPGSGFAALGEALESHRHSLETLRITFNEDTSLDAPEHTQSTVPVGSLRNFDKLSVISVTSGVLLPSETKYFHQFVDKLPPCLERLLLSGWHETLFLALIHLGETCQESFPKLKEVEVLTGVWQKHRANEWRPNGGLDELFQKEGVRFIVPSALG